MSTAPRPARRRTARLGLAPVLVAVTTALAALLAGLSAPLLAPTATAATATQAATHVVDAVDTSSSNLWVDASGGGSTTQITVGDTVEWQFDRATMAHDVTSLDSADDWAIPLREYRDPQGSPVTYTFTKPGTYEYWCSIHGGTMRGTVVVTEAPVNQAPTANPLVDPTTGVAPLYTHFEARATDPDGDTMTYLWDFGESTLASDTSTSSHAHHSYANPGRYTASLKVTDGRGGTFTRTYTITVTGGVKPIVTASANPTSGTAPLAVVFMGGATDEQGGNLAYAWDFGDPGTETDTANVARAGYTYTTAGTYTAVLTVTDAQGNAGTGSVTITVGGGGGGTPSEPTLTVQATATPTAGTAPLPVQFGATVTNPSTTSGALAAFADGTTTYDGLSGTATMVRAATSTTTSLSATGLKPSAAHMVHVHEEPCASNNAGPHFRFDTAQPYSEANEIWLPFTSDAAGASGDLEVVKDRRAGPKAVSLVIHDPDNMAKRIGCVDLAPTGLDHTWDFGDGSTGVGATPTHTYTRAGTYDATVTVVDQGAGHVDTRSARRRHGEPVTDTVRIVVTGAPVVTPPTAPPPTPAADTRAPSISKVGPRGRVGDRTPTLRATVRDTGSRLTRRAITLRVDGAVRPVTYDARTGRMTWTPGKRLAPRRHTVRLVAVDAAGNRAVASWRFTVRR